MIGIEKQPPVSSTAFFLPSPFCFVYDFLKILYVSLVVSASGDGSLEFSPPLTEFETQIPDLLIDMANATQTLPALDVATIDLKFYEDPLTPIFSHEITLDGYFSNFIYSPYYKLLFIRHLVSFSFH